MLSQRRYEEKEKTLFTKSIFPSLVRTYAICVTSIFYHISVGLSIKLENLTKNIIIIALVSLIKSVVVKKKGQRISHEVNPKV